MKMERSYGPLVSFAIHALILFCIFHFVSFVARDRGGEIRVQVIDPETIEIPDDWEPDEIEPPNDFDQTADMFAEMEAPDTPSEEVQDPVETSDILEDTLVSAESPIVLRNVFMGRTASKRAENMRRYGGKHGKSVEAAVMKALRWLKQNQRSDGSWAGEHPVGTTGMALLAFLAHGETPASKEFGSTVEKAVNYLLRRQDGRGNFSKQGHGYGHAVATYALAEAYGMTRIPMIRPAVQKGVGVIIDGMQTKQVRREGTMTMVEGYDSINEGYVTYGCWDYNYKQSGRLDTSFGGWQVQALKAAAMADIEHVKMGKALALSRNGLKYAHNQVSRKFRYNAADRGNGGTLSMTGVGTLGLQLLGHGHSTEARQGMTALSDALVSFAKPMGAAPFYSWYYITQAKFHQKGTTWSNWNDRFAPQMVKHQQKNGSWLTPVKGHEQSQGVAYTTSISALGLMVYYRHLPTYKEHATKEYKVDAASESGDIKIDIL